MDKKTGVARLRQAITNQATCGGGQFELSIDSADRLCREIEDELAGVSWAQGAPVPVDADGNVVPLTTVVMYDDDGKEVRVSRFSLTNDGFEQNRWTWNARVMTGFIVNLDDLRLHCPDSWEQLEKDAELAPRDYLQGRGMNPDKTDRIKTITTDIVRRARALAERDGKEER